MSVLHQHLSEGVKAMTRTRLVPLSSVFVCILAAVIGIGPERVAALERAPAKPVAVYEAETDLRHGGGFQEGGAWACAPKKDEPSAMCFGPEEAGLSPGPHRAEYLISTHTGGMSGESLAQLDVYDKATDTVLITREIQRRDLTPIGEWVSVFLPFTVPEKGGKLEFRVFWYGKATFLVDKIAVY